MLDVNSMFMTRWKPQRDQTTPGVISHVHPLTHVTNSEFNCAGKAEGYYASPKSCQQYYICVSGIALKSECHSGLVFNSATQYCDFSDNVQCSSGSNVAPATVPPQAPVTTRAPVNTWAPPVTTRAPSVPNQANVDPANFCQGQTDGIHKDPADCSRYFNCAGGKTYHLSCPGGTYFKESIRGCDWAANVPGCP